MIYRWMYMSYILQFQFTLFALRCSIVILYCVLFQTGSKWKFLWSKPFLLASEICLHVVNPVFPHLAPVFSASLDIYKQKCYNVGASTVLTTDLQNRSTCKVTSEEDLHLASSLTTVARGNDSTLRERKISSYLVLLPAITHYWFWLWIETHPQVVWPIKCDVPRCSGELNVTPQGKGGVW